MTEDGFREFVEVRYGELLRTAYLLTGSQHAAEDLVQNALLRTMRRWRTVQEPMAYVRRVMVNDRLSVWRRIGSRELLAGVIGEWGRDRGRVVRDPAETVVVRDELLEALERLPARMRTVLVLRFWDDLPEAQIAELLGCAVGTVKSQISRGLTRLRAVLPRSADPPPLPNHAIDKELPADAISGRTV